MAKVSNVSDIKKALIARETTLIPTNKKTEFILIAASKLPATVFAAGATAAVISGGATAAVSAAVALTSGQIWAMIATVALIALIGMLRAKNARIGATKHPDGTWHFGVEYSDMKQLNK